MQRKKLTHDVVATQISDYPMGDSFAGMAPESRPKLQEEPGLLYLH